MLILVLLWLLAPLLMIALGAAGLFAIAIIISGVRAIFGGCD